MDVGLCLSTCRLSTRQIEPQEDVSGLVRIGEEVSWYYDMEPASLRIIRTTRPKYARPKGEGVITAPLPPLPIEKGNAGPGLMAQVTIDKFVYHLPLDRQRKKFHNDYAVNFSESWLCDLVKNVGFWIRPVYAAYIKQMLKAKYLCADETPIRVLVKDRKGRTHRGYFWLYYDPLAKIVIFDYRKSRSRDGPVQFLKDYRGILQVDGYDGYNEIIARNGIRRMACMDHVRRKFEQALGNDRTRASHALDTMREWYALERTARDEGLSLDQRFERRVAETVPSMKKFGQWLKEQLPQVLPKSAIGIAVSYALNQWPFFEPFQTDAQVEISNIKTENKVRPVAIGRKNYLFKGSHEAAQRGAMIYSLVATAKNHGINPYEYIKDLLTQLPAAKNSDISRFLIPSWQPPE